MQVSPVTLEGKWVRLEPLDERYIPDLVVAAQAPEIWEFMAFTSLRTADELRAAFRQWAASTNSVSFIIVRRSDGRAVGMTAYLNIAPEDRALEIGGTWLDPQVWRTPINTECKYLLLRHAFETLGCVRVQLKTDSRNIRSQRAIERLGAVKEGVLRKHMIIHNGYVRDTFMYSIIDSEWPAVKERLEGFLKHV